MTKQVPADPPGSGDQDPWAAFGYLVSGVALYGFLGWVVGRWLHADYWIPIGIVVGLGFGLYLVFTRYRFRGDDAAGVPGPDTISGQTSDDRPVQRSDRGEQDSDTASDSDRSDSPGADQ